MISPFFILLFLLFITFFIWWCMQKNKSKFLQDIPGPKPYPLIGNALDFGWNNDEFLKNMFRICRIYKPTAKFTIGPNNFYLLTTDPELAGVLLNSPKCLKKSHLYDFFKCFYNNGLLTADVDLWHKRRKMINPTFNTNLLKEFNITFNEQADILIRLLSEDLKKGDLDINEYVTKYTADVVCATVMGVEMNVQTTQKTNEFIENGYIGAQICIKRIFSVLKRFDFFFQFTFDYRELQRVLKYGKEVTESIVEQRRQKLLNNDLLNEKDNDAGAKGRNAFLDTLLTTQIDGKPLSNEEVMEEVNVMATAGFETTSSFVAFTINELAKHPDIQDKVYAEIREIFKDDKNHHPSFQDYNEMKYTELVLKETARLYTTVPFIGRQLDEDINYKGTLIPKDTNIIFFFSGMHRREDLFPNAEKFDPERFLPGNTPIQPNSFLPFSAGPRNCIGQKYAMLEAKCILSRVIMNFQVLPPSKDYKIKLSVQLSLKPLPGLFVRLKSRP